MVAINQMMFFLFSNLFYLFLTLAHRSATSTYKYDRGTVGVVPGGEASVFVLPQPKPEWGASGDPSKTPSPQKQHMGLR